MSKAFPFNVSIIHINTLDELMPKLAEHDGQSVYIVFEQSIVISDKTIVQWSHGFTPKVNAYNDMWIQTIPMDTTHNSVIAIFSRNTQEWVARYIQPN